ncbi:unnamed protein product, partial [marine sediment metagenome]
NCSTYSNMITGDFSITATNAYLVEKGEIVYPVKSVSLETQRTDSYNIFTTQ